MGSVAWLVCLIALTVSVSVRAVRLSNPSHCHYNGEGTWSVGIMEGKDWGSMRLARDTITLPAGSAGPGSEEVSVTCPRNPILACSDVTDVNASFVADPFLFFPNGTGAGAPWYAFFEVKNMNNNRALNRRRGQIGTAVSYDEGVTWKYLQIVLTAGHHLSYPQIVEHKGELYMLPQGRSMSLFKCKCFPTRWKYKTNLLSPKLPLQDITVVFYQEKWWAVGIYETRGRENWILHIYYADDLLGPWHSTPNNCVGPNAEGNFTCIGGPGVNKPHKRGSVGVRPGGRMFIEDGRLYRMVQDSRKMYGDGMHLYEVTSLTIDQPLEETPMMSFENNFRAPHNVEPWNSKRFHHADLHKIPGHGDRDPRWVMLVDGDYNGGRFIAPADFPEKRCADIRMNI